MTVVETSTQPPPPGPWTHLLCHRGQLIAGIALILIAASMFLAVPSIVQSIIAALREPSPDDTVPPLALTVVGLGVVGAAFEHVGRLALLDAALKSQLALRSQMCRTLTRQDASFFRKNPTGDLMSRATSDIEALDAMWFQTSSTLTKNVFIFLVGILLMFRVDGTMATLALIQYPCILTVGWLFGRFVYKSSKMVREQAGRLASAVERDLMGVATIKAYGLEPARSSFFRSVSKMFMRHDLALLRIQGLLVPVLDVAGAIGGTLIMLYIGGHRVADGTLTIGQVIEFDLYLGLIAWPILSMGQGISTIQKGRASWERIAPILAANSHITDGPATAIEPSEFRGEVEFRRVDIDIDGKQIIDSASFSVPAGSTTAIVGATGAGKSTLLSALPRLVAVADQSIFIDGRDINELPLENLRALVCMAPQDAFLFAGTISENIGMGMESERDSRESDETRLDAISGAADAAGLGPDLEKLPSRLETVVGERGLTLSGGQRQRVALARTLTTSARVLIFDDSLSAVDATTEQVIRQNLRSFAKGRTCLTVSNRLSAIRDADQIIVLDEGRIVERGSHDSLMEMRGVYFGLYADHSTEGGSGARD